MTPTSARLYLCARCREQVVICGHCDRGQRYCGQGCAAAARREATHRAGQRYQRSRRGRHRHAERQRHYRRRQRDKVTHQGSPAQAVSVSLLAWPRLTTSAPLSAWISTVGTLSCRFCARLCSVFVRLGFKRRRGVRRPVP